MTSLKLWTLTLCYFGLVVDTQAGMIHIGSEKQFFIDDYLIESLTATRRVLNPAKKVYHNPIIRP